jgi:hypothetical protein
MIDTLLLLIVVGVVLLALAVDCVALFGWAQRRWR